MESDVIVRNAFPNWSDGKGIFSEMTEAPWKDDPNAATLLDAQYFGNHSGLKFLSPLAHHYIGDDGTISDANRKRLANLIWRLYGLTWQKQWDVLNLEYEPLENYEITEDLNVTRKRDGTTSNTGTVDNTGTVNSTDSGTVQTDATVDQTDTGTVELAKTGTDTQSGDSTNYESHIGNDQTNQTDHHVTTHTGTDTTKSTTKVNDARWGFNSDEKQPTTYNQTEAEAQRTLALNDEVGGENKSQTIYDTQRNTVATSELTNTHDTVDTTTNNLQSNQTGNNTETRNLTRQDTRDLTEERNLLQTDDYTEKETGDRKRHGFMGWRSKQTLLLEERNLWDWDYFKRIFRDLDAVLTLPIYDPCVLDY